MWAVAVDGQSSRWKHSGRAMGGAAQAHYEARLQLACPSPEMSRGEPRCVEVSRGEPRLGAAAARRLEPRAARGRGGRRCEEGLVARRSPWLYQGRVLFDRGCRRPRTGSATAPRSSSPSPPSPAAARTLVTARSSPRATTSHARSGETSRESPGAAGSRREPPSATTPRARNGARPSSGGLSRHYSVSRPRTSV